MGFPRSRPWKDNLFASDLIEDFLERTHKRMEKWDRDGRVAKPSMVSCKIQKKLNLPQSCRGALERVQVIP